MSLRMRHRRSLTVIALAAAGCGSAAAATSAGATPFAGQIRDNKGAVNVMGTDGHLYQVGVELKTVTPAGGTAASQVSVSLTRCSVTSCSQTGLSYTEALPSSAVSYNGMSATVRTVFSGTPLAISWSIPSDGTVSVPGAEVTTGNVTSDLNTGPTSGTVNVAVWRVACSGSGSGSSYTLVSSHDAGTLNGAPPPARTPAPFAPRRGRHTTCQPSQP
jgi:hypothetical protein